MNRGLIGLAALPVVLLGSLPVYAASTVDLTHQDIATTKKEFFTTSTDKSLRPGIIMQEIRRELGAHNILHIRLMETYKGYPVFGGDSVVHIPNASNMKAALTELINANTTVSGKAYKDFDADLATTPALVFSKEQAEKALQYTIAEYQQKLGAKPEISQQESQLMVYVDSNKKAHWVFQVSFHAEPVNGKGAPQQPIVIVDAVSFDVYEQWDDLKTVDADTDASLQNVMAGGNGGNDRMGKLVYDGGPNNLSALAVQRSESSKTCYMQNSDVTVKKYTGEKTSPAAITFACESVDQMHNNVYWRGALDAANGGYSPADDAIFAGIVIKKLYQDWYGIPVLKTKDGKPMMLNMVVHKPDYENAYWDDKSSNMYFGDGGADLYPLTSLGIGAHEISHGFTSQHSNLKYRHQSGGMNESFSDMASQAAEFYAYGQPSWEIVTEVMKDPNAIGRSISNPTADCAPGQKPGRGCSIESADQYSFTQDVHYTSGVYNRMFYLIATAEGWDVRKAFNVMVEANSHYWTSDSDYNDGACGILRAAKAKGYDTKAIKDAFAAVKVDPGKNC